MRRVLVAAMCVALLCGVTPAQTAETAKPAAPAAPAREDGGKFGLDASKVTVKFKDSPLDDILHALAEQSGNTRLEIPGDWEAKGVTFDVADLPYWQALDSLCAQLKLCYALETTGRFPSQKTEITLQDGKGYENIACYCGPVVLKLAGVTATRRFLPASSGADRGGLELSLAWFCEDRLHALETRAEVTKLTASDGKDLALNNNPPAAAQAQGHGAANVPQAIAIARLPSAVASPAAAFSSAGTVTAKVDALPKDLRSLKSVEGVVRLTFGKGTKDLKVEDVFGGNADSAEADKDKLTVTQARKQMNWASVVLQYAVDGRDADLAGLTASSPYGVRLIDPKGEAHAPTSLRNIPVFQGGGIQMQGGNGNVQVRIQVQGVVGPDGANGPLPPVKAPIQGVPIGPAGVQGPSASVTFMNLPDLDGKWTLVVTVPQSRVAKDFAFKLNDIPLP